MAAALQVNLDPGQAFTLLEATAAKFAPGGAEEFLQRVANMLERNLQMRFETETDPDGQKWKPWAEATREHHERTKRGAKILQETGRLRDSVYSSTTPTQAILNIVAPYAIYHDAITPRKSRLPRRGLLRSSNGDLGKKDLAGIQKLLEQYVHG